MIHISNGIHISYIPAVFKKTSENFERHALALSSIAVCNYNFKHTRSHRRNMYALQLLNIFSKKYEKLYTLF